MKFIKNIFPADIAALSHIALRILCEIIVEYDCARLVEQSSGTPAVAGNFVLASIYGLGLALSFVNKKAGYLIAIAAGSINIIAKIIIIIGGHEHFPYYPIVWITQSLLVIYFSYRALKANAGPATK